MFSRYHNVGFTLVETLVAIGMLVLLLGVLMGFEKFVFSQNHLTQSTLLADQDARVTLRQLTAELRAAVPSATGAYPLAKAEAQALTFFSDVDKDGAVDQVRYFASSTEWWRGVTKPSGAPASYQPADEQLNIAARNLLPNQTIFSYYDNSYAGTTTPLTQPLNIAVVRLIKVNLNFGSSAYTTQVTIRSLKDNL